MFYGTDNILQNIPYYYPHPFECRKYLRILWKIWLVPYNNVGPPYSMKRHEYGNGVFAK